MELWQEIYVGSKSENDTRPQKADVCKLLESRCYIALQNIKDILDDDKLDDDECFMKIEKIVRLFEEMGSDGGSRHDF